MFFMEKFYLPRKLGHTFGVVTLALAGVTVLHALDSFGEAKYYEGQGAMATTQGEHEAAHNAQENIDQLQTQIVGNVLIALGFIGVSSLSFYLTDPVKNERT